MHHRSTQGRRAPIRLRRNSRGRHPKGRPDVRPVPLQEGIRRSAAAVRRRARQRPERARIPRVRGGGAGVHDGSPRPGPDPPLKLGALLEATKIAVPEGAAAIDIRQIAYDSRKAKEGALFVAIPGFHRDGHGFAKDAVGRGAVAVLAEHAIDVGVPVVVVPEARAALADIAAEFFDHPTRKLKLAAVTGTDGKTTTVHLVSDVLEASGAKTGFSTTVDFKVADHEWKNDTRQSTQEAVEVQEFFAELLVAGGTWEYLEAKGELFAMLAGSTDKGIPKTAVLNGDDRHWRYLADRAEGAKVVTYGIEALCDVQGAILASDAAGSRMRITASGQSVELRLPLVGRFNVHNALAAAAAGLAAGATLQQARDALSRARAVRGRMERVESGQPFSVIVDYAHTPESFDKVLGLLRPLTKGKLIAVFGSAGERDRAKRPALAEVAAKHADFFVITQEDPRLEEPAKILEEIEQGAIGAGKRKGTDYVVIDDRREAVSEAIRRAAPEDTVLLAGKGHEESIIVGEEKRPYDEATAARDALKALGFGT
ncbi:MAG: UDP-N-acetylmuramoyl-L-alanyl-D-glutamate--2,6-diaminopimelate ligase [Chloroflexi bacterium]|nr:MAG: UDP-N-acetylmuramoyl-L-alanyl-D-glutamate--2,6-diaminopimelate ligase [Chloroflexota bacterium]